MSASGGQLIEPLSSFVGRARELEELARLTAEARLVTLVGPGGCGKTRLALRHAAAANGPRSAPATLVELASAVGPGGTEEALLRALGTMATPGTEVLPAAIRAIGATRRLLVLDNCEHVRDGVASLVEGLLRSCPGVSVLATSREPLHVGGEIVWPVPPLALEDPTGEGSDATILFTQRARAVRADLVLDGGVVERICRALDGLPLAIELAAARARVMSTEEIAAELDSSLSLLGAPGARVPERQRTMRASIEWSHSLLDEDEQRLMRRLAVFEAGFYVDAANAVCDPAADREQLRDRLAGLVEKSLVQASPQGGRMRFRMLDVVRQFATERLDAAGERALLSERHLDHFAAVARRAGEPPLGERAAGRAELAVEFPNLRRAVVHAATSGDERGLAILVSCTLFQRETGRVREAGALFDRMLAATAALPASRLRTLALAQASIMAIVGADFDRTVELCRQAISLGEQLDEPQAVAGGLVRLGVLERDPAAGESMLRRAVALARAAGDFVTVADGLSTLVVILSVSDDFDLIEPELAELERASAQAENRIAAAYGLWERCRQGIVAGDPTALRRNAEELLAAALEVRDPIMRVVANQTLAIAATQSGSGPAWRERLLDELALAEEEGAVGVVCAELGLGWIALGAGDVETVRRHADSLLARGAWTHRFYEWSGVWLLLEAALLDADAEEAGRRADQLARIGAELGNRRVAALALVGAGRAALLGGDDERAGALLAQGLDGLLSGAWLVDRADALEWLAALAARQGRWEMAVALLAAVAGWRSDRSLVRVPPSRERFAAIVGDARAALGSGDFDAAWERGRSLSLDQAIELARRGRGRRDRALSGFASLTRAEAQVAGLAAQGLSNPEIAERLFVARGTVKAHLARVYAKLGVANRTELARTWAERESVESPR